MSIEKTVSEIAEILGVSRQAVNNRVKQLPEEDLEKNAKGVTVVKRSGLIKLEEIYKKTIFDDEPIDEETKQRELLEILVDEKNSEIARLYAQLKAKDEQLSNMDDQLRVKDVQIAEKDKQIDQQQQLTLTAMKDKEELKLELDEAKGHLFRASSIAEVAELAGIDAAALEETINEYNALFEDKVERDPEFYRYTGNNQPCRVRIARVLRNELLIR